MWGGAPFGAPPLCVSVDAGCMTDMNDLVEAFKREVSIPGRFATDYPTVTDEHVVGLLGDGFAEAQLMDLFGSHRYDVDSESIVPSISQAGALVVILFAARRMLRQRMETESASVRYKAGPVEMQQSQFSNVLTTVWKSVDARLDRILQLSTSGTVLPFVIDGYSARSAATSYGAMKASELPGTWYGVDLG